jgi:hypothetical protein
MGAKLRFNRKYKSRLFNQLVSIDSATFVNGELMRIALMCILLTIYNCEHGFKPGKQSEIKSP